MTLYSPKAQAEKLFQSAERLVRQDRYDSALLELNLAIQHAPTAQFYDYRGVVLALTGRNEAARESFSQALSLSTTDSERAEISFHRGLLYGRDQFYEQALLDLVRACRLNRFESTYREALDQFKQERDRYEY